MAESGAERETQELMTLTEVSHRTGISSPTLQKYKKRYADRIPSVGEGRRQRYPKEALEVFQELKKENMARRGRPRKSGSKARKPKKSKRAPKKSTRRRKAAARASQEALMSLRQAAKEAGISYQTALRYVREQLGRIPHQMVGKRRKFPPEAVKAIQAIRQETPGGRPPKKQAARKKARRAAAAAAPTTGAALEKLVKTVSDLEGRIAALEKEMKKPLKIEVKR
jgi:DNA-binding transcriptional MerR regulator